MTRSRSSSPRPIPRAGFAAALLLAVATALGAAGCNASAQAESRQQPPPGEVWLSAQQVKDNRITLVTVKEEEIHEVVTAGGKVAFDDLRVAHVFSPVTGRISQILAQPGQRVKKGDALARITSPEVGGAYADVVKAQADLIAAEHEWNRQQELVQVHAGSRRDYETAEDNFRKARAEHHRAQQRTRLLRSGSANSVTQEYTLRAPIDGEVVARTNVNPGAEVAGQYAAGNAVELFTLGELDVVWVLADVFEVDLPRITPGGRVRVEVIAYPKQPFWGKVEWISSSLDPASRTAKVRCVIPNPKRELKPEMYATITIVAPGPPGVAVPRDAILRLGDQTVVLVAAGETQAGQHRFERRPVSVNEDAADDVVPVTRGLKVGEQVVGTGAALLGGGV